MKKQVDKSHYRFRDYMSKKRWASVWHQLDEVSRLEPESVLEIGPGAGLFKNAAASYGIRVETLDIDPDLGPDHVGSADSMPFPDHAFDVVCAFQVLEHMPFDISLKALSEMQRVARKAVVISLPDVKTAWASTISIPKFGALRFVLPRIGFKPKSHTFDGQHYWEISKKDYSLERITAEIRKISPNCPLRTYRVHENQYHRFFIIEKPQELAR